MASGVRITGRRATTKPMSQVRDETDKPTITISSEDAMAGE